MQHKTMGDFVKFIPGINPTRAEKQFGITTISYYDQAAFDQDFKREESEPKERLPQPLNEEIALEIGDVIISNTLQSATIVSAANAGKVPSLNFTKVEFYQKGLDKYYFVYLFNAYSKVQRQKERELQGNGPILKIPIKSLNQIEIPIIPLAQQQKIGRAYHDMMTLQSKMIQYNERMAQLVDAILEENLKEKSDESI